MAIQNFSSVAAFKAGRATLGTDTAAVSDTSANLQAVIGSLLNDVKVSQINSADNANINIAIGQLSVNPSSIDKLAVDDIITVTGATADIQTNLIALLASDKIDFINPTPINAKVTLNVAQESVAANMAKLDLTDKVVVSDTSAAIQGRLAGLFADAKVDVIDSKDATAITLKANQFIQPNNVKLSVNDNITVADKSTALQAKLVALLANGKIDNIDSTTPATAITLTAEQALTSIAKFNAADKVNVVLTEADTGLTAEQLNTLRTDARIDNIINSYSIVSDVLVDEGSAITFTISALVPVAVDTKFTYQIQGDTANPASASDVAPASGSVIMLAGRSTALITVNALDEGVREFNEGGVFILSNSTGATQIATQAFLIQDGASYVLNPTAASANEGTNAVFTLSATNVADDTVVTYTLSGVTAGDIVGGSLTGSATVSGGVATITVPLAADLTTEAVAETLKVSIDKTTASATTLINDTSKDATFALAANQATADEGASATFTLTSPDAADGSIVAYTLSGVTAGDVTDGMLAGQATITGGSATITVPLALDVTTEGTETLTVIAGGKTATTTIVDKSFAPELNADAVTGTIVNGQGAAIMNAATVASWLLNDKDSTGAVPAGAITIDMTSAVGGQLILLNSGDTAFIANAGLRLGSFQYSVAGLEGKGTVNVTLNNAPVVTGGTTLAATEDVVANGTITVTDANSDALTYTFANGAFGTVVAGVNGAYTYTPNPNYNGADTIKVTINDGYTTVTQDIAVTVASVNDDPQALAPAPAAIAAKSGQTGITVDLANYATDPDLGAGITTGLTFAVPATTTKGGVVTLGVDGHTVTIAYPQAGGAAALGADTLAFTVKDTLSAPVAAAVTLNVTNTAPTATDFSATAKTGITQIVDFTGKATDAEGNTLITSVVAGSLSSGGSAEVPTTGVNAGKLVYTSTIGFVGTETMQYQVSDGFGGVSALQTISFQVASNTGGTSGDDLLYGSTNAENIDGLAGNDTIVGGGGVDTITGGTGNDFVTFNDDAAQILGASGSDTLVVNADAVASVFDLSQGDDQNLDGLSNAIVRTFENVDATKSSNDFILNVDASSAAYAGKAGGDATTTMSILTGEGNDFVNFSRATGTGVVVKTNDGNDTIYVTGAATGVFNIDGGAGNDIVNVSATTAVHTILGGAGNDTVLLGAGLSVVDGGEGTDSISVTSATVDTTFTRLTNFEAVTVTGNTALTLDTLAAAAGIKTVSETAGTVQTFNINAGFTNDLTVNLNTNEADVVAATAYTKNLTVKTTSATGLTTAVLTGGTGTADQIVYDITAATAVQAANAGITAIEKMTTSGSTTNGLTVTLHDANVATGKSLTIDGSALTTGVLTVNATAETNGSVIVLGGGAADMITGSASTLGDSLSGAAGNDTFVMAGNLTAIDSIAGGEGTDTITVTTATLDAAFTKVTTVEGVTVSGATLTLGALAAAAGINTVTQTIGTGETFIVGADFTNNLTVVLNDDEADVVNAAAYTKNLTVTTTSTSGLTPAEVITGGVGTADQFVFDLKAASINQTANAGITAIEKFTTTGSTTNNLTVVLDDANIAAAKSLTIDGSALTTGILTVNASAETNGSVVVMGGGAADMITGSASTLGDSLSGAAGNDTFVMAGNLTAIDSIDGGANTDTITVSTATLDAAFTKVTTVEAVTVAGANALTLDTLAAAAGINTANETAGTVQTFNVNAGFTNDLTVNLNTNEADVVAAAAYTKNLTVKTTSATGLTTAVLTGGTGAADQIVYDLTAASAVQAANAGITAIEKMTTTGSTTNSLTVTLADANIAATKSLTIDGSVLTTGILTVDASAETNGSIVVLGGGAADVMTLSASTLGDNLSGNAGNDTFTVATTANLTSIDTITGGIGTDNLTFSAATSTLTDAMFTKVSGLENVVLTNNSAHVVTLGTAAVAAGVVSVSANVASNQTIDLTGMTGSTGVAVTTGAGADTILGSFGNDTIVASTGVDIITGGAGGDIITVTANVNMTTARINLNADMATGTTLTKADQITGFAVEDLLDLSGATLMSTGGSIKALTVGNDGLTFRTTAVAGDLSNLALLANQTAHVFSLTADFDGAGAATFTNQAGIDAAVSYITATIGTSGSVQNTNVLLTLTDGTNTAVFNYHEGAVASQGIQASELTLVGVLDASTAFSII